MGRVRLVHSVQSERRPRAQPSSGRAPNFCSTVPPGSSPLARSKFTRWGRHFESRVRSRVWAGAGIFPAGRQIGGDGKGKRRAGEDARVNSEWARMKSVHSVQSESRPRAQPSSERGPQFLFDRPAGELPTFPFKVSRWGGHFESRVRSRVCGGCEVFSAGRQASGDGEGNGGREKTRG